MRLIFHLLGENSITLKDKQQLSSIVSKKGIEKTMFTEWMKMNSSCSEAQMLTYSKFPSKFVWSEKNKTWRQRKFGRSIGRIYYAHPTSGERYYLRILLNIVRGVKSYEEIKTVGQVIYDTFKEACYALGLLAVDKEWVDALNEASQWAIAFQLRLLFVTILLFGEVANVKKLWEKCWKMLSDDILSKKRKLFKHFELQLSDQQI